METFEMASNHSESFNMEKHVQYSHQSIWNVQFVITEL